VGGTCGTNQSQNYVPKFDASCALINSAIVQNGSNQIGIGTASPAYKLDVNGEVKSNVVVIVDDGTHNISVTPNTIYTTNWNGTITLYPTNGSGSANSNQLFLAGSGKVGIGTSSPATKLHVKNGNVTAEYDYSNDGDLRNVILNQIS